MDNGKFSGINIRDKFRGKNLGSVFNSQVKRKLGASNIISAKGKLSKELAGRSLQQRKSVYKNLEIDKGGMDKIEKTIVGKGELTLMEKARMKEETVKKIRRNIFASRRSADESAGDFSSGGAGYEESTGFFAGGDVKTRTRVSSLSQAGGRGNSGMATRPGMSGGNPYISSPSHGSNNPYTRGKTLGSSPSVLGKSSGRPLGF